MSHETVEGEGLLEMRGGGDEVSVAEGDCEGGSDEGVEEGCLGGVLGGRVVCEDEVCCCLFYLGVG